MFTPSARKPQPQIVPSHLRGFIFNFWSWLFFLKKILSRLKGRLLTLILGWFHGSPGPSINSLGKLFTQWELAIAMLDLEMDRNWGDFHRIFMGEMVILRFGWWNWRTIRTNTSQWNSHHSIIWQNKLYSASSYHNDIQYLLGHIPMAVAKKTN